MILWLTDLASLDLHESWTMGTEETHKLEPVQWRVAKFVKGLENMAYQERLMALGLCILEKAFQGIFRSEIIVNSKQTYSAQTALPIDSENKHTVFLEINHKLLKCNCGMNLFWPAYVVVLPTSPSLGLRMVLSRYKEEILPFEGVEALERVAQRSFGLLCLALAVFKTMLVGVLCSNGLLEIPVHVGGFEPDEL
ncbi:hypothetical protein BTVI_27296 [Pitangus sulphuratus]|nr:hypothetical protein BTVI_27296 [Pitangus sulphuratus]